MEQRYSTGEEIHGGDRVRYVGCSGTVVFVIDRNEYSPEFPVGHWSSHSSGFVVQTSALGLVLLLAADEDLELIGRGASAA